jgi:hypothetical protein
VTGAHSLADEAHEYLVELAAFVDTAPFQRLVDELWSIPSTQRHAFVRDVVLDPAEREKRGVHVPPGMQIRTSRFGDGRPTLFCVTKALSVDGAKVTVTFDNAWE